MDPTVEDSARPNRRDRIDAALGRRPATVVIRDARIVSVFTREILPGDVALLGDRIVAVGDVPAGAVGPATLVVDAGGSYLLPGFIEPHFHAAEPSLCPLELGRALLERGTTTLATDLVEFYAVGGVEAVRWALAELEASGIRVLFLLPVHAMGMEEFGTMRHLPTVEDFATMAAWPQTAGINEPPPNTVIDGDGRVVDVLDATLRAPRVFEGHMPALRGAELQAYLAAGATSDHESTDAVDALAKLRLGCRIIMRECSASRDLAALLPLLLSHPGASRFFMVCSDDMQVKELVDEGHVDHKLRVAIGAGLDPLEAIELATINPSEYFGLSASLGSIAPGKLGDLLLVDSLTELRARVVITDGRVVHSEDAPRETRSVTRAPPRCLQSVIEIAQPVDADSFQISAPRNATRATVRVVGISNGTLLSQALTHEATVVAGAVAADIEADVLKAAVLDRHTASGRIGLAFVNGVGLKQGALATTFNWPHYALLVVGASDAEMAAAVVAMQQLGGGLLAVRGDEVLASVEFPVGGIVGTQGLEQTHEQIAAFEQAARSLGSRLTDHLTALAALTIPHIPKYGLTDHGLFDGEAGAFVDIFVSD